MITGTRGWNRLVTALALLWILVVGAFAADRFYGLMSKTTYDLTYEGQPMPGVVFSNEEVALLGQNEIKRKAIEALERYKTVKSEERPHRVDLPYQLYTQGKWQSLLLRYGLFAFVPPLFLIAATWLSRWVAAGFSKPNA
jgi:hypothetical protein